MQVPLLDLARQDPAITEAVEAAALGVLRSGAYILGPEVEAFEHSVAEALSVEHAIGVSSGTDALLVSLMALGIGPGDEVITTPFSFYATAGVIARVGATPVFADIEADTLNLDVTAVEAAIGPKVRAVVVVHLFGRPARVNEFAQLCEKHDVALIEDAAQAILATSGGRLVGSVGALGCFSFFPSKNLGAAGDGGLVTTCDSELAARVRTLRSQGAARRMQHDLVGGNFRLDALQAAILSAKLPHLDKATEARRHSAAQYRALFETSERVVTNVEQLGPGQLLLPSEGAAERHVYNQYVVRVCKRDALAQHLSERGIASAVYYPTPLHRQPCFAGRQRLAGALVHSERATTQCLAIPNFPGLTDSERQSVVAGVLSFLDIVD
jgi:dTDP-4-amino-4,6-dideoxygalactose transaminase